jgi:hypothetical protein
MEDRGCDMEDGISILILHYVKKKKKEKGKLSIPYTLLDIIIIIIRVYYSPSYCAYITHIGYYHAPYSIPPHSIT